MEKIADLRRGSQVTEWSVVCLCLSYIQKFVMMCDHDDCLFNGL